MIIYKYIQDKGESTETETATTRDVKDENEMIIDQRKAANNSFIPSETIFNAIASVFPGILWDYFFLDQATIQATLSCVL